MNLEFPGKVVNVHEVPQCCYSEVQGDRITSGLVDINLF